MEVNILYIDKDLLVCVKPAGIATQTARLTQQDMVSLLRNQLSAAGESTEIHVVHRLDQPVEGLLVFARHARAAAWLDRQVSDASGHAMCKEYLAMINGVMEAASGRLEDLLIKDARTNMSRVAGKGEKGAKKASLYYETMEVRKEGQESLLKIRLETGRHHQIRVQMAHAGHPLVGDSKYGSVNPAADASAGKAGSKAAGQPLMLCAYRLRFQMPDKSEKTFEIAPTWL